MSALDALYNRLHTRFPPSFELLLLSYRWTEVYLDTVVLLANPPGDMTLDGFAREISKDKAMFDCLTRAGYVQFGRATDGAYYDPICFNRGARKNNGDRAIVRIDHEEILCNDRIKVRAEVAPGFDDLMLRTIEQVQ
jgi:hypothetical protein